MRDLKFDSITGDISTELGDLVFVDGIDALEQDCRQAMQAFQGEWFLDETDGVPYFQSLLGKKPNTLVSREVFRKALLAVPGVVEVLRCEVSFNGSTRTLTVAWKVSTDLGEIEGEQTI
jgi:hypothetical protein